MTNAAPYAELEPQPTAQPIRLVHSGACLRDRGISEILNAVERTSTEVMLDLYLTPNDPEYLAEIVALARGSARSVLHAPVPYSDLIATLNSYDVGVHLLPPVNFNNAWALPNKFFDYVQARLGVVIGPSPEMAAIIGEYGFGAVAGGFGADDLIATLDGLDVATVADWKERSSASARALSSESQVLGWKNAVAKLLG